MGEKTVVETSTEAEAVADDGCKHIPNPLMANLDKAKDDVDEKLEAHADARVALAEAGKNLKSAQDVLNEAVESLRKYDPETGLPKDSPMYHSLTGDGDTSDDECREIPLDDIALESGILDSLEEHEPPITTMGELQVFTENGGKLTDIEGIGKAAESKILNELERYWADWRKKQKTLAEAQI